MTTSPTNGEPGKPMVLLLESPAPCEPECAEWPNGAPGFGLVETNDRVFCPTCGRFWVTEDEMARIRKQMAEDEARLRAYEEERKK